MQHHSAAREVVAARVASMMAEAERHRAGRRPGRRRRRAPGPVRTALGLGLLRAGHRLLGLAEVR